MHYEIARNYRAEKIIMKNKNVKRPVRDRISPWRLVLRHGLALGAALLIFALPHHVLPQRQEAVMARSSRGMETLRSALPESTPEPTPESTELPAMTVSLTPEPTSTPEPTPEPADAPGSFRIKFADKFIEGKDVRLKDGVYRSENLNITLTERYIEDLRTRCYLVDIYIADISCLQSGMATKNGKSYKAWPYDLAEQYGSVITINGDYAGARQDGVVIRNGALYRNSRVTNDVCVIYWDGVMKTFSPREFDADREIANGAYQAWNFGPELLDENGDAKTTFNSSVKPANPRTVIGYYEPGHYCFLVADGRSAKSRGITMTDLSRFMKDLGCKAAYNLDGGKTSMLCAGTKIINNPYEGGRKTSDVVMLLDRVQDGR